MYKYKLTIHEELQSSVWRSDHTYGHISSLWVFSCCVISDIENKAKKDTKSVFKHLDEFLNKKPKIVIEKEAFQGPDNFTNVCEE